MAQITLEYLAQKVREMREAQDRHSRTKSESAYADRKRREKEVDDLVSSIPKPKEEPKQATIF